MNNKNYLDTIYPLDKTYKKGYNGSSSLRKNKSIFDNDPIAQAALDYLYSKTNRDKTKNFLANNGLPSFEDREYNKKYYGEQEESRRILDLFREKTNGILNSNLPDDTDRAFLSGLLGKDEEENNYRKKLASSNRALGELQDAFRGSQFEGELNPTVQRLTSAPTITNAVNRNPNTQLHTKLQNNVAFLKGFNYLNGEMERWEEEKAANPNGFQPNVLGIAPMGREGRMWCWIAAASMVDQYYHPENSASQQEIANQLGKGRRDGGYIEETSELGKGSRSCTTSGFSDRISAKELTYEKIQEEMQGKHPIVLLTKTGNRYESEHYVVIVGCYTNGKGERYVIVNETREDTTKKEKPGLQRHIPYEQLKGVFSTGRGANQKIKAFYTTRPEKDEYHK